MPTSPRAILLRTEDQFYITFMHTTVTRNCAFAIHTVTCQSSSGNHIRKDFFSNLKFLTGFVAFRTIKHQFLLSVMAPMLLGLFFTQNKTSSFISFVGFLIGPDKNQRSYQLKRLLLQLIVLLVNIFSSKKLSKDLV